MKDILDSTLEELDGEDWGEPTFPSALVTNCHRLRRVPLRNFTTESFRILIGQRIGLEWLVPLALDILAKDPLAEGDFYRGDLLRNVHHIPAEFWQAHPDLLRRYQLLPSEPLIDIIDEMIDREYLARVEADRQRQQQTPIAEKSRSVLEIVADLKGHRIFSSPEEVDRHINEERDSWE